MFAFFVQEQMEKDVPKSWRRELFHPPKKRPSPRADLKIRPPTFRELPTPLHIFKHLYYLSLFPILLDLIGVLIECIDPVNIYWCDFLQTVCNVQ